MQTVERKPVQRTTTVEGVLLPAVEDLIFDRFVVFGHAGQVIERRFGIRRAMFERSVRNAITRRSGGPGPALLRRTAA